MEPKGLMNLKFLTFYGKRVESCLRLGKETKRKGKYSPAFGI